MKFLMIGNFNLMDTTLFDAMFVITLGDFFLCLTWWFDIFLPAALLTAKVVNDVKFSEFHELVTAVFPLVHG